MPTSAPEAVTNLPKITVKTVQSAGPMWASAPTMEFCSTYGVRIFSEVGVGTTAEIEFPAVMQKPGADSALRLRMKKAEQEDADT